MPTGEFSRKTEYRQNAAEPKVQCKLSAEHQESSDGTKEEKCKFYNNWSVNKYLLGFIVNSSVLAVQ